MVHNISTNDIMLLPVFGGVEVIDIQKIIRIEGISNYSKLHFNNGKTLTVAKLLRWFESMLPDQDFFRIHKTHVVNKKFIQGYTQGVGGQVKLINGDMLNVSRRRKACFLQRWYALHS